MTRAGWKAYGLAAAASALWAIVAGGETLTADRAVQLALRQNIQVIGAEANLLDARGGMYGAWSPLLPHLSASLSRFGTDISNEKGGRNVGGGLTPTISSDFVAYGTTPSVGGSWSFLNLSSIAGFSSARGALKAARLSRDAIRSQVALDARRQFYEVVKAVRLAQVATGALHLARDDERRVRALFEVGSVSRSDLLKAQVRTAQSELDSLTASQTVIVQRITLAGLVGVKETEMGEVDTVLAVEPQDYDEGRLLSEASSARPDIKAADADVKAAQARLNSARFSRLPYVTASASVDFNTRSRSTSGIDPPGAPPLFTPGKAGSSSETDRQFSGQVALNWNVFDGLQTDSRIASARAQVMRARADRDALRRNLESEVHQALIAYREAVERDKVARRALESATENLKLTQEKYNVGSATVLELIDAQVQLQRAQSDGVSALAAIRVAEAQLDRVRGRAE